VTSFSAGSQFADDGRKNPVLRVDKPLQVIWIVGHHHVVISSL
jgi:hypothetical protein